MPLRRLIWGIITSCSFLRILGALYFLPNGSDEVMLIALIVSKLHLSESSAIQSGFCRNFLGIVFQIRRLVLVGIGHDVCETSDKTIAEH